MKLGGNAFRTILHISFFDVEKFWGAAARPIRTETGHRPIRDRRPDRTGPIFATDPMDRTNIAKIVSNLFDGIA